MLEILVFVWLLSPIVLGILLIVKSKKYKRLVQTLESKEKLLEEYRKQNGALQKALRSARENVSVAAEQKVSTSAAEQGTEAVAEKVSTMAEDASAESVVFGVSVAEMANSTVQGGVADTNANADENISSKADLHEEIASTGIAAQAVEEASYDRADQVKAIDSVSAVTRTEAKTRKKEKSAIPSGVILFGIGILLVLTAGAIFATTTWNILPAFGKISVLLGAVAVFYGGAFIAEKKLKLRNTSITLFILGSAFLAVINLAAGYFGWYGPYYSLEGEGQLMLWCISSLITAFCLIAGGLIYRTKILGMLGYYFTLLAVFLGTAFVFDDVIPVTISLGIVMLISLAYIQLVEYRLDIDVIGSSFVTISYIYNVAVLILALFYLLDNSSANIAENIWPFIALMVMALINLAVTIWRLYMVITEKLATELKGSRITGIIATGFAIVAFGASIRFVEYFFQRMNISLIIFLIIYALVLVMKKRDVYDKKIKECVSWFSELTLLLVMFTEFIDFFSGKEPTGIMLLITAAILYLLEHISGDTRKAFISSATFFTSIAYICGRFEADEYDAIVAVIMWGLVILSVIAGRLIYKNIVTTDEAGTRIDWISIGSSILLYYAIERISSSDAMLFITLLLLAAYIASFYKRSNYLVDRLILTAAINWAMFVCSVQPFFDIPREFKTEWFIIFGMAAVALVSIVWRKHKDVYIFVWLVAIAVSFLAEFASIEGYSYSEDEVISTFKLVIYLAGMIALFVVAYLKDKRCLIAETGFAMVGFSCLAFSYEAKGIFILAALCGVAYLIYLHAKNMSVWAFLPIVQIYLLLFALDMPDPWWLLVFVVVMIAGFALHRLWDNDQDKTIADDMVNVSGIIPVFAIATTGTERWIFCAIMMLAIYILSFYKRYNDDSNALVNKMTLTLASVAVAVAWIIQPWFELYDGWKIEWIIVAFMAVCLFNMLVVYKQSTDDVWGWITFAVAIVSVIVQGESAIVSGKVVDALILGIVMLGLLIWAYMARKKQWFLLAAITLVAQCIYASREFWKSIAWWVYLLLAGAVLIAIAARSEYKRRQGEEMEEREAHHFFQDWTL